VLSEAWDKVNGCKWQFFLAYLLYSVITVGFVIAMFVVVGMGVGLVGMSSSVGAVALIPMLMILGFMLILMPMTGGFFMMGVKRSMGGPVDAVSIFSYFSKTLSLFFTWFLMMVMVSIGTFLLVLPGIYLMVAYYMAIPLVIDKGMSPWQALEASRKAVTHRWFAVFGWLIIMSVIMMIAMIPMGLGMIWVSPMFMIAFGIIYRNMFGVEAKTLA